MRKRKEIGAKCRCAITTLAVAAMTMQGGMAVCAEEMGDADQTIAAESEAELTETEWIAEEQTDAEQTEIAWIVEEQTESEQTAEEQTEEVWIAEERVLSDEEEEEWIIAQEWVLPEAIYQTTITFDTADAEQITAFDETEQAAEKTELVYENEELVVKVIASVEAALPENTEVKVTKLEADSAEYIESKKAVENSACADENAVYTFYKVILMADGKEMDVPEGTVSIRLELKTDKVTDVLSIEETESGKVVHNLTDSMITKNGISSLNVSY